MKKPGIIGSWVLGVALLFGCGRMDSELLHTVDEPVRFQGAWQWADTSHAAYTKSIGPLIGVSGSSLVDQNHALVGRMQFWLDRFDGWLRTQSPQDMHFVPKPQVEILKEASVNAFVAPLPICYSVGMKWSDRGGETDAVFVDTATGELSIWPSDELKCETGFDNQRLVDALASLSNDWQSCRIVKDGASYKPQGCDVAGDLAGKGRARKIVLFGISNRITVHTALIAAMEESEVAAVLAHELTHYYRAHGVAAEKYYDYFYRLGAMNGSTKPDADHSLTVQGKKAVSASELLTSADMHEQGGATEFRSELFSLLGSVIHAATTPACVAARDWLTKPFGRATSAEAAMGKFPLAELTDEGTEAYKKFLEVGAACGKTIEVAAGEGFTGKKIGWRTIRNLLGKPSFPKWQSQTQNQTVLKSIRQKTVERFNAIGQNPVDDELWGALVATSIEFQKQDRQAAADLKAALDDRLGQYTAEQEADDMSLELLADGGLEPKAGVEAMRVLGKGEISQLSGFAFGEDECNALMANRWQGPNGDSALVPIGDYSEVHHSTCFRMWNMEREIAAHGLTKSNLPLTLPTTSWSDLQRLAKDLSDDAAASPDKPTSQAVSIAARRAAGGNCIFGKK